MRKLTLHAALIGALLVVFGAGSYAVAHGGKRSVKTGDMSGYLEAPPVSSAAEGEFSAKIDDSGDKITYRIEYEGLEGTITQSHIHFGQRSVSGGISAWLCETATNPSPSASTPTCPQSGTVTGTITPLEVVGPGSPPAVPPNGGQGINPGEFEELVAAIRAGRAYANVHSNKFPAGEIRGQINDRNQRDD
jgi:hypothetical protein